MSTLHIKSCLHISSLCLDYESVFYQLANQSDRSWMRVKFSFELLLWVSSRLGLQYVSSNDSDEILIGDMAMCLTQKCKKNLIYQKFLSVLTWQTLLFLFLETLKRVTRKSSKWQIFAKKYFYIWDCQNQMPTAGTGFSTDFD